MKQNKLLTVLTEKDSQIVILVKDGNQRTRIPRSHLYKLSQIEKKM